MSRFGNTTAFQARVALLLALLSAAAAADQVRLKNGNTLEGIIRSETPTGVVLEVEFGTLTLSKDGIAAIERAGAPTKQALQQAWQQQNILHERYTPPGLADLQRDLMTLQGQHGAAAQAYRRLAELQQGFQREEQELRQAQDQEIALNKQLSRSPGTSRSAVRAYNDAVARLHGLQASLLELGKSADRHLADMDQCRRELASYTTALLMFAERAKARQQQGPGGDDPQAVAAFFAALNTRLQAYLAEIKQVRLPVRRDLNRVEVTARLNGTVEGRFVVDTGATTLCISEALAQKLHLARGAGEVQATMADGSLRKARAALLDSVEIEGVRVSHVVTVILPQPPAPGVDGLLGMSFLMECNVRLDPATGGLTLQRFAPPGAAAP